MRSEVCSPADIHLSNMYFEYSRVYSSNYNNYKCDNKIIIYANL